MTSELEQTVARMIASDLGDHRVHAETVIRRGLAKRIINRVKDDSDGQHQPPNRDPRNPAPQGQAEGD